MLIDEGVVRVTLMRFRRPPKENAALRDPPRGFRFIFQVTSRYSMLLDPKKASSVRVFG